MFTNTKKLYNHRLLNLRIMVRLLRLAPFVRCVILNGSMAEDFICHPEQSEGSYSKILRRGASQNDRKGWHIKPSSDIDLLIIAKSKRIYTCRAGVIFLAYLTGLKRSNRSIRTHAGRFCFNYFLTEDFLIIPHDRGDKVDRYCADNYSKSILWSGDKKLFEKFMRINSVWMKKYLTKSEKRKAKSENLNRLPRPESTSGLAMTEERLLSGRFGDWLEKVLKNIQVKRITKDPESKKYPEFIVYNDKELRFHLPQNR